MNQVVKLEKLDTGFVNLGALLRHLRQLNFVGRVKVVMEGYEAEVFLQGAEEPRIWEENLTTGSSAEGKDALERLLVRSRDPGGVITIFEGTDESRNEGTAHPPSQPTVNPQSTLAAAITDDGLPTAQAAETDWDLLLAASGELIGGVERAVRSVNEDFAARFRATLIEMGDDYPFLDPTAGLLDYHEGKVALHERPAVSDFVTSLSEGLRRLVTRIVDDTGGVRFRERVAVELAVIARRNENAFAEFTPYLDRIAGTRVL